VAALKPARKFILVRQWDGVPPPELEAGRALLGVGRRLGEEKMDTSRYIARLMGPVMLVIGIGMAAGMFVEGESYSSLMKEFIGPRALILITGVLALLAGLIIVNAHNLWVPDWRVLITALGWLAILRGVMNLVLPALVQTMGDRLVASHAGVIAGAAFMIVLGAILSIMGYEALWNQDAREEAGTKRKRRKK
jgi:hypothetical protein